MELDRQIENLKYDEKGLIPVVIQDAKDGCVLMVAYMNAASLKRTVQTGYTHFWSRSRGKMWMKGESSGHSQKVREIRADCDRDCLLIVVEQAGPGACHTGHRSCFYSNLEGEELDARTFDENEVYKK